MDKKGDRQGNQGRQRQGGIEDRERRQAVGQHGQGKDLVLTDEKGGTAKVTISNVFQSNGVIHVIDTVLMPN